MKDYPAMTEQDHIEAIQDALGTMKKSLRAIQKENADAGRNAAANSAMGLRGKVIVLHSEMTQALETHYPEMSAGIQVRGGGGRGG